MANRIWETVRRWKPYVHLSKLQRERHWKNRCQPILLLELLYRIIGFKGENPYTSSWGRWFIKLSWWFIWWEWKNDRITKRGFTLNLRNSLIALGVGAAAYQYARKQDVFSKRNMKKHVRWLSLTYNHFDKLKNSLVDKGVFMHPYANKKSDLWEKIR